MLNTGVSQKCQPIKAKIRQPYRRFIGHPVHLVQSFTWKMSICLNFCRAAPLSSTSAILSSPSLLKIYFSYFLKLISLISNISCILLTENCYLLLAGINIFYFLKLNLPLSSNSPSLLKLIFSTFLS